MEARLVVSLVVLGLAAVGGQEAPAQALECGLAGSAAPSQTEGVFTYKVCNYGLGDCETFQVRDNQGQPDEKVGAMYGCLTSATNCDSSSISDENDPTASDNEFYLNSNQYVVFSVMLSDEARSAVSFESSNYLTQDPQDPNKFTVRWGATGSTQTDENRFPFMCTYGDYYGLQEFADVELVCTMNFCARMCSNPDWDTDSAATIWQDPTNYQEVSGDYTCMAKQEEVNVGEEVRFTLAMSNDGGGLGSNNEKALNNVIEAAVDGGVPIGMQMEAAPTETDIISNNNKRISREVSWMPRKGQQGETFFAHFVAASFPADENDLYKCPVVPKFLNVSMRVARPDVSWETDPLLPPEEKYQRTVVVGQEDKLSLDCLTRSDSYLAQIDLVSVWKNGVETDEAMPLSIEYSSITSGQKLSLTFEAAVGDEGSNKTWCFACGDSLDVEPKDVQCITWTIELCKINSKEGDTLQSLTRKFHLDRNWRRLWNANRWLNNPYVALMEDQTINLGTLYRVRHADTLQTIAGMFETTVKRLLMVNPHIEDIMHEHLPKDTDLCILPCTNQREPSILGGVPSH